MNEISSIQSFLFEERKAKEHFCFKPLSILRLVKSQRFEINQGCNLPLLRETAENVK